MKHRSVAAVLTTATDFKATLSGQCWISLRGRGHIMKLAWVAAVTFLVGMPTLAMAGEKVDMSELTCKQFLADQEGLLPIAFWIDGYLSHQSGNSVIDVDELVANVKKVAEQCASEPDKKVMELLPEDE